MGWLEDLLGSVNSGQGALMSAYAQGNPQTGGTVAPDTTAAPAAADPFRQLLAGLAKRQASQRPLSFLEQLASIPKGQPGGGLAGLVPPGEGEGGPAGGLAALASVTGHGPRAGQAHLTYDAPGGYRAHAYVDPLTGKRSVYRFKP